MRSEKSKTIGFICAALACLFWGTSFVAGKVSVTEIGVVDTIFYRLLLASAIFLFIIYKNKWMLDRGDIPLIVLTAFLTLPVTFFLQFYGLSMTSASHASLMIGMEPVFITFATFLFSKTSVRTNNVIAAVMAFLGVAFIASQDDRGSSLIGDAMVLASTLVVAVWVLLSKRLVEKYPPLMFSSYITIIGTLAFVPIWIMNGKMHHSISAASIFSIIYLAIFCTIFAQVLWNYGLKLVHSHEAGIFLSLEPLSGVFFGILILGEPFHFSLIVGGALLTIAVFLNSIKKPQGK